MISFVVSGDCVCHEIDKILGLPIINVLVVVGVIVWEVTADTVHDEESTWLPFDILVLIVITLLGYDVGGV